MLSTTMWQWVLGFVVVLIYGTSRFDTPNRLRSTTTYPRYFFAKSCYVGSVIFLFVLLSGALTDPKGIYYLLSGGVPMDNDLTANASHLPGPLLAALFMTSLLPTLPVLKKIDDWLKVQFQRLGNIPFEARYLSSRLNRTAFEVPSEIKSEVTEELSEWDAPGIAETFRDDDLYAMLVRVTALMVQVLKWDSERRYGQYVEEHMTLLQDIKNLYASTRTMLIDEWSPSLQGEDAPSPHVTNAMRKRIRNDVVKLNSLICDFIAGGLLQCERSAQDRARRAASLGFDSIEDGRRPLRMDQIAGIALSIFSVMAAVAFVFDEAFGGPGLNQQFRIALMVAVIYIVAIVVAIYPKSIWSEADAKAQGARPYAAYIASAIIAAALAFFIALTFRYVFFTHFNFLKAVESSISRWPWLVMTAGATFLIAWVADNYVRKPETAPQWIRLYEAVGTAAAFCVLQWFVQNMLVSDLSGDALVRESEELIRRLVTSGLVGAVIGFSIPHMCRVRYLRVKEGLQDRRGGFQPT